MKIVHIIWSFRIGGIQTMLVDIVNEQIKKNQVEILVVNNRVDERLQVKLDKRVSLYCYGRIPGSHNPIPIVRLNYHLYRYKPDIIHCHEDGITRTLFFRAPMIRTIHNTHSEPSEFHKFKCLCCISKAVKKRTDEQGYLNSVVVYNGILTDSIEVKESESPNDSDLLKIVCVGRLHPMKGQAVLIDAVNILVNNRKRQNVILSLIGDGPSRKELEAQVKLLHLADHINFEGSKSRGYLYRNLKKYDLFVMPSICEGFGLTLAEACAAKIPVITSDLEGPMEVIDYGKYGFRFKSGDAESLADAIELASKRRCDKTIEDAYIYVKNMFNVKNTAISYIKIYTKCLKNDK